MIPQEVDPVKLFIGILSSDEPSLEMALQRLEMIYGPMDFRSEPMDFDITDYYIPEMGAPILRSFVAFETLILPNEIARIKIETNELELKLAKAKKRKVNLDPGYMDYDKVVLASAKYNGQKVYLEKGIWADLTLHFERGRFIPYSWSFPDFRTGMYEEIFLEIRSRYKGQRRRS